MRSSALLTWPNRRVRTRMSGGVGGEESRGSPLSQFDMRLKKVLSSKAWQLSWAC
jgi:hypothetical protein